MLRSRVLVAAPAGAPAPDPAAATRSGDRSLVAEIVAGYQRGLGAPGEAVAAAERLADPHAVAIVAGQQPGLLGGPMFTLAKALSAIAWSARVEAEHGLPAVAVFWVASEDHDLAEVNRTVILDQADAPHTLSLDLESGGRMLSEIREGGLAAGFLEQVRDLLPQSEFQGEVAATLIPPAGASLGRWFASVLSRWLGRFGLVVVEPHLFREAGAAVLDLERESPGAIAGACAEGPVTVHRPPFFLVDKGRRRRPASAAELPRDPGAVSWDVVTRVLAQNLVLPVAGHVVGPSEARYCAQVAPAHSLLGLTAPPLLPRAGFTLVEGKVEKALLQFGVEVEDVLGRGEAALAGEELRPEEFDRALGDLEAVMLSALRDLRDEANRVDDVLLRKTEGAEKEMLRSIDRLRDHARKAMDRVTGKDAERREKVLAHLLPGGKPQERALSPLPFLVRHGLDLVDRLLEVVAEGPCEARAVFLARKKRRA